MSKSILEQLDEAEKAATAGKWTADDGMVILDATDNEHAWWSNPGQYKSDVSDSDCDAELIALMRNNIRSLLDVAKAAESYRKAVYDDNPYHDEYAKLLKALAKLRGDTEKEGDE